MAEAKEPAKRSLGRGLGSLLGDDAFTATPAPKKDDVPEGQRIWNVAIEKIVPNSYQPRKYFDTERIRELAASIKEKGILQPIVARKQGANFEIIAGERRWRAAQVAGLREIPVIVKEVRDQESLELALIENLQRHDLNPLEEAEAYQLLIDDFRLNQNEVAQKLGKERATVTNTLRLLGLNTESKKLLVSGEISQGHAKALLAITDPAVQTELARKIASEKLTVREAERLVRQALRGYGRAPKEDLAQKLVEKLQEDLSKHLGTKVRISYRKGKGTMHVRFYSDEDLNRISEVIRK